MGLNGVSFYFVFLFEIIALRVSLVKEGKQRRMNLQRLLKRKKGSFILPNNSLKWG